MECDKGSALCSGTLSAPGYRALPALVVDNFRSVGKEEDRVESKEAMIGMRVRVDEALREFELRGLLGTIRGRWGDPEYVALDVLLDDGRLQLFWHHELEEIEEGV
jgi:hypothetical protein